MAGIAGTEPALGDDQGWREGADPVQVLYTSSGVLDIDKRAYEKWASPEQDDDPRIRDLRANGAAYFVSGHALSNLRMRTGLT